MALSEQDILRFFKEYNKDQRRKILFSFINIQDRDVELTHAEERLIINTLESSGKINGINQLLGI